MRGPKSSTWRKEETPGAGLGGPLSGGALCPSLPSPLFPGVPRLCGLGLPRLGRGPWLRHLPQLPLAAAAFQKPTLLCAAQPPPPPPGLWLTGSPWWWQDGTLRLQGRGGSYGAPEPQAALETWHLPGMTVGGGARAVFGVGFPGLTPTSPQCPPRVGQGRGLGGGRWGLGGRPVLWVLSWAAARLPCGPSHCRF